MADVALTDPQWLVGAQGAAPPRHRTRPAAVEGRARAGSSPTSATSRSTPSGRPGRARSTPRPRELSRGARGRGRAPAGRRRLESRASASRTAPVVLPLREASRAPPGARRALPGLDRPARVGRRVRRAPTTPVARRLVRLRPARRARRGPAAADHARRRGGHRAAPPHADRRRGGRGGRGLASSSCRPSAESETLLNTGRRGRRGPERPPALRQGQDLNEQSWVFGDQRAEVARDGDLRLGGARLRRRPRPRPHGDDAGRRGRGGQGHRRLRAAQAPARRLRHHAGARGAQHDVRPRVPRHPRATARRPCGAA